MRTILILCSLVLGSITTFSAPQKPILLVLTNHAVLGQTGHKTGFFLSEAAHPWAVFTEAGYEVVLASPKGGLAPVDPKSRDLKDDANARFWKKFGKNEGVPETQALTGLHPDNYAAIFFAGGHGSMWDFPNNPEIARLGSAIYAQGGVVGAVCHGPSALVGLKLADGTPLVRGRALAVFTNAEEAAVQLTQVVPFLLADELEKAGAKTVPGDNFKEHALRDGRLVTGQNPASAHKAAQLVVEALREPKS